MNKKPITKEFRIKIQKYIKARMDISEIIKGYDIKGMNLERAIISEFNRPDEDLSGTNFANAIIGKDGRKCNCSRTNFSNCNFKNARVIGIFWFRYCNLQNCNFTNCHMPHVQYPFADLRGSDFCGGCFPIGTIATKSGIGATFSDNIFSEIANGWDMTILTPTQIQELLEKPEFKPTIEKMLHDNHLASKEKNHG